MKKLIVTMLTFLGCGTAFALPVGNPAEASFLTDGLIWEGHCGCDPCDPCLTWCDAFSVRAGFYGDYVFNRGLRNRGRVANQADRSRLDQTEIYTNAGYLALNFWDRFDAFATLGTSKLNLEGNASSFGPFLTSPILENGPRVAIETRYEFSWSVGARALLWECGCTALGLEGQYFRTVPRVHSITFGKLFTTDPTSTLPHLSTQYSEWQVGLGLSHRINIFVPYVAVKYSRANLYWNNARRIDTFFPFDDIALATLRTMKNQKNWGYAVGVSVVDCEKMAFTIEGRFGDEKALYVNSQIRF